jgi:hypothetical protein
MFIHMLTTHVLLQLDSPCNAYWIMDDRHETLMHQTLVLSGATPFAEMLHYTVALVDLSKLCTFLQGDPSPADTAIHIPRPG